MSTLLHPKFNHLGRSKRKELNTKKMEQARKEHEEFLKKHNLKPRRKF